MVLKHSLPASSIAEVVMALAIIATCFGVASLVFVRVTNTVVRFQDVKTQTEIQSEILLRMYLQEDISDKEQFPFSLLDDPIQDSLVIQHYTGTDQRVLWQQQWFRK